MAKHKYEVRSRLERGVNDENGNTQVTVYGPEAEGYERNTIELDEREAEPLLAAGTVLPAAKSDPIRKAEKALKDAQSEEREAARKRQEAQNALTAARAAASELLGERRRGDIGSSKYESEAYGLAADPDSYKGQGSGADDRAADQAKGQSKEAKGKEG